MSSQLQWGKWCWLQVWVGQCRVSQETNHWIQPFSFLEKKENIAFFESLSNIKFNEDFIRSQCVSILSRLHWLDKTQFRNFMKDLVDNRNVSFLLSFFHSYLGFCSEASNPFSPNPNVIAMSRKKSPSRQGTDLSPIGYQNNFGETMGNYIGN